MKYLVYQQVVLKTETSYKPGVTNNNTFIDCIIRLVEAETSYEAIGKFIESTSEIKAEKKLDPIQIKLDHLIKIK